MGEEMERSALIAMSGGVDSSVAAYLMKKAGWRCVGATMRLYRNDDIGLDTSRSCCTQRDVDDAARVAAQIGIPYDVLNYRADFRECVIDKFIRTYERGGTPNPCIDCNRYLKFEKLFYFAWERGLNYIVTGHYARIEKDEASGRYLLKRAADPGKDQSYVLYSLTQRQLAHVCFPLGSMTKTRIREIAQEAKLPTAHKSESQDICFVPDGDYVKFMEEYTGKKYEPGNFVDKEGNVIGRHRGAVHYTIGQRKGLGIAMGHPVYVCAKDMRANTVTLGENEDLYSSVLTARDVNLISVENLDGPMRIEASTRYRQKPQAGTVSPLGDGRIRIEFDQPQRAITTGQAVVMYDGDVVVGGGTIE